MLIEGDVPPTCQKKVAPGLTNPGWLWREQSFSTVLGPSIGDSSIWACCWHTPQLLVPFSRKDGCWDPGASSFRTCTELRSRRSPDQAQVSSSEPQPYFLNLCLVFTVINLNQFSLSKWLQNQTFREFLKCVTLLLKAKMELLETSASSSSLVAVSNLRCCLFFNEMIPKVTHYDSLDKWTFKEIRGKSNLCVSFIHTEIHKIKLGW